MIRTFFITLLVVIFLSHMHLNTSDNDDQPPLKKARKFLLNDHTQRILVLKKNVSETMNDVYREGEAEKIEHFHTSEQISYNARLQWCTNNISEPCNLCPNEWITPLGFALRMGYYETAQFLLKVEALTLDRAPSGRGIAYHMVDFLKQAEFTEKLYAILKCIIKTHEHFFNITSETDKNILGSYIKKAKKHSLACMHALPKYGAPINVINKEKYENNLAFAVKHTKSTSQSYAFIATMIAGRLSKIKDIYYKHILIFKRLNEQLKKSHIPLPKPLILLIIDYIARETAEFKDIWNAITSTRESQSSNSHTANYDLSDYNSELPIIHRAIIIKKNNLTKGKKKHNDEEDTTKEKMLLELISPAHWQRPLHLIISEIDIIARNERNESQESWYPM